MKKTIGLAVVCFLLMISQVGAQETARQDVLQAYQLYQAKNYVDAEKLSHAAIQLDPSSGAAHQMLGNIYLAQGRQADAVVEYKTSLSLMPNNPALSAYVQTLQAQVPAATAVATNVVSSGAAVASAPKTSQVLGDYPDKPHFILGVFGGLDLPTTGFPNNSIVSYGLGYGGGAYVGGAFDRHFSVALKLGVLQLPYSEAAFTLGSTNYPASNYALTQFEVLTSSKYIFGDKDWRPYVTAGTGMNVDSDSGSQLTVTLPLFEVGAGLTGPLENDLDFFAELDFDFTLGIQYNQDISYSYVPFNVGVQFNGF